MLQSEQMLYSNPTVSNVHDVIYLLFSIFRQLPIVMPLSLSQPPYGRFPYGLVSPADAYTRGLQRMPTPPPLMSEFVGMVSYALTCHPNSRMVMARATVPASMTWRPATVRPRSALWRML